jgi:hypothetical protein
MYVLYLLFYCHPAIPRVSTLFRSESSPNKMQATLEQVFKKRRTTMERSAGTGSACVNDVPMPMNEYISRKV